MQADNKSDIDNHITALLNDILAPTNDAELRGVLRTVDVLTDFVELDNVRSILADDVLFRENRELALIAFDILRKMHDHRPDEGPAQAETVGNEIEDTMTAVMGGAIAETPEPAESAPDEAAPGIVAEAIAAAGADEIAETPAIEGMGDVTEAPKPVESESGMFEAAPAESMPDEIVSEVLSAPPGLVESESGMFDAADVEPPPDETVSEVMDEVIRTSDVGEVAETPVIESMSAMAESPEPAESEMLEVTPVESMPEEVATGVPEEAIAAAGAGDVAETPTIKSMGAVAEAPEPVESELGMLETAPVGAMPGKAVTEIMGVVIGAADAKKIAETPEPVGSMPDEPVSAVIEEAIAASDVGRIAETPEPVGSMPDEPVSAVIEEAIAASDVGRIAETPAIESISAMAEFPESAESEMLEATPVESLPDEAISEMMGAPPGLAESKSEMFEDADVESVPEESSPEFKLSAPEISTIIEIPEPGSEEPEPESPESTPEFPGFSEDGADMSDMADTEPPESAPDFPGFSEDDSLSDDNPFPDDGTVTLDMVDTESPDFPGISEDSPFPGDNPFPDDGTATPDMAGALADTESLESAPVFPGFSEDDSLSDDAPFPGASPDTPDVPDTGGGSERTWELTLDRIKELKNKYVNKL
ncbi:MAG: hypothetical protein U9N46_14130 [Euryarchaeota archaeon]|nr:hypothetical protein [Euryarchaeota archaeon]